MPSPRPPMSRPRPRRRWWQRRQASHRQQKLVRSIEEVHVRVDCAIRCSHKDSRSARVVDRDIRREARAATRLLDDVRRRVGRQNVNPAEADARRFSCMVESFLAHQIRRQKIDRLRRLILRRQPCSAVSQQIFQPDRHVRRRRVKARTSRRRFCNAAGPLVKDTGQQMVALFRIGEKRCAPHVQRVQRALRQQRCILCMRRRLQRIAEKVIRNIRIQCRRAGNATQMLIREPAPARAIVRIRKVRPSVEEPDPVRAEVPTYASPGRAA